MCEFFPLWDSNTGVTNDTDNGCNPCRYVSVGGPVIMPAQWQGLLVYLNWTIIHTISYTCVFVESAEIVNSRRAALHMDRRQEDKQADPQSPTSELWATFYLSSSAKRSVTACNCQTSHRFAPLNAGRGFNHICTCGNNDLFEYTSTYGRLLFQEI